jgi:hypothetical protein
MKNHGAQYWAGFRPEASAYWPGPVVESARCTGPVHAQRAVAVPGLQARRRGGALADSAAVARSSPRA